MKEADFRGHIAELKAACNAKDIAAALGLEGQGRRFFCPSCQSGRGKTPDLVVSDDGFKCWKCGAAGDVIDLVVLDGKTKAQAIEFLETKTGIKRLESEKRKRGGLTMDREKYGPSSANMKAVSELQKAKAPKDEKIAVCHADLYSAFLSKVCRPLAGTPGATYLESRGISVDVASRFGVCFCADLSGLWSLTDRDSIKAAGMNALYIFQKSGLPFLVFPYMQGGKPVFLKSRCLLSKDDADALSLPRFLNTAGSVPCLWNHDAIAGASQVIITEGEIDGLSAIMAGFVGVGLPGWSHWKDAWTKDFIGKEVFLVLDGDEAGMKGTADIARRFLGAGAPCPRQIILPKGKDLNDVFQDFMKDGKAENGTP